MAIVYIGLGANLNNPVEQLKAAQQTLQQLPKTELLKSSSLYGSKPLGPQDQPDYVNAVCQLQTELEPLELLKLLQQLEIEQGRIKKRHWGERVIDLDILLYDDLQMQTETLTIPHSQMALRDFVLLPLAEIAPQITIPNLGKVKTLIEQLAETYVVALKAD